MSTQHEQAAVRRVLTSQVDDAVERLRAQGALDRRSFFRAATATVMVPLLAACNAQGTPGMQRVLGRIGERNEAIERWLLQFAGTDRVRGGMRTAGDAFPSYHIADQAPVWDAGVQGPWALQVDGAVKTPMTFDLARLRQLATATHTVNHYCVEGWSAAIQFQGVPFATIAKLVQPRGDAGYVDFASFDEGYHESWDIESTMHPQTLVAIAKDGEALNARYGAPARIHSPVKLGYKNTKYLTRITFMTARNGGYWSDKGYEWFGGT